MSSNEFCIGNDNRLDLESAHPEIKALMLRLAELQPEELAEAFYQIESKQSHSYLYHRVFSKDGLADISGAPRALKHEMEFIYLELAKHLRANSKGSVDLMNAVYDLLGKTLISMIQVPAYLSMN